MLNGAAADSDSRRGAEERMVGNNKSHMGFHLVPKLVTVNDLERRNGHVVASFCQIW